MNLEYTSGMVGHKKCTKIIYTTGYLIGDMTYKCLGQFSYSNTSHPLFDALQAWCYFHIFGMIISSAIVKDPIRNMMMPGGKCHTCTNMTMVTTPILHDCFLVRSAAQCLAMYSYYYYKVPVILQRQEKHHHPNKASKTRESKVRHGIGTIDDGHIP